MSSLSVNIASYSPCGRNEMDSESDDSAGSGQEDSETEQVGGLEAASQYWDNFLALVAALQRPWDADEYREERAVEAFNLGEPCYPPRAYRRQRLSLCSRAGALVSNDLIEINPSLRSWVPHIMVFIVPQQILRLGDPAKRSCDACESFGAK